MAPPPATADADEEDSETVTSRWVSVTLFVVLLGGGLALLGYALVWPFLAGP
jgi:hypothetical protein